MSHVRINSLAECFPSTDTESQTLRALFATWTLRGLCDFVSVDEWPSWILRSFTRSKVAVFQIYKVLARFKLTWKSATQSVKVSVQLYGWWTTIQCFFSSSCVTVIEFICEDREVVLERSLDTEPSSILDYSGSLCGEYWQIVWRISS